ncbi:histidine kinase [Draconibacterium sp. IB214405]|uniref:sensor histidine kinase n=1 Tax=Draconibacterium sp. IB214405 TaxID=3097352 RepID=UPI002A0DED8F|nr:histidine kinase [Draconibacterium sp. IB214405]MDX8337669.1 histidine kinase [Draconibacterium sp. IB214405]
MIVFIFSVNQLHAQKLHQEYTSKHYTIHDGLAQMQVMSLFQDSKGYLWSYTKAGLSRFDGKHFKNYTDDIKIAGFDIITMGETEAGNLLLFGPSNFAELEDGSVEIYNYPDNQSSSSLAYFCPKKKLKEIYRFLPDNKKQIEILSYANTDSLISYPVNNNAGQVIYISESVENLVWQTDFDSIYISELKTRQTVKTLANPYSINQIIRWRDDYIGVNNNYQVFKLINNTFHFLFQIQPPVRFFKIIQTPSNDALIIKTDCDIFYYKDKLVPIKQNLTSIRDILFDYEDNLWVATEEGLYNFFQLNFVNYTFSKGNKDWVWSVIEDDNNNFWFASYQNGLWKWDRESITDYTDLLNTNLKHHIANTDLHKMYRYYMGASRMGSTLYFPTECNVLQYKNDTFSPVEDLLELPYQITKALPDSTMIFAGFAGLFIKKPNGNIKYRSRDSVGVSSILSVEADTKNRIVAVGKNGVAVVSNDSIIRYQQDNVRRSYSTTKDHKNNIWIGGIKNLNLYTNDTIIPIAQKEEEAFYSLLFVAPHYLFMGGIKGLYVANLDDYYKNGIFETVLYNESSGFTGLECGQNGFFTDSEEMIWIPTSDLVTRFDPKKLIDKKITSPRIFLNTTVSPDNIRWQNLNSTGNNSFNFNHNNIRFLVDVISFANAGNIRFYYKLEGLQDDWLPASEINEVTFYQLKPGTYRFLVKADAGVSSACSDTLFFDFEIQKPFWQKWWFILSEIILLALLVYFLVQFFRKKEQQKAATRQRLMQLKSEALAAQLDPHFVMNCLNNISGLVNAGHKEQANTYIVKFSKLLRVILQSIKKESISLSEELEIVKKYMELEQFRCNDCFSYEIVLPENCSTETISVPSMMLQPLVENSIKHGFSDVNNRELKIQITITTEDRKLRFSIADNGKGLQANKETSGTGLGTQITRERIELLQKKSNIKFEMSDRNPGVEIKFEIPLLIIHNKF